MTAPMPAINHCPTRNSATVRSRWMTRCNGVPDGTWVFNAKLGVASDAREEFVTGEREGDDSRVRATPADGASPLVAGSHFIAAEATVPWVGWPTNTARTGGGEEWFQEQVSRRFNGTTREAPGRLLPPAESSRVYVGPKMKMRTSIRAKCRIGTRGNPVGGTP